jgi:anti-sigma factor RsiW
MNECSAEGGLRAYLDRELPPEEMTQIAVHLGGCAACHTRYNELAGRAARVAALMETLQAGPIGQQFAPTGRRWRTGAAVLALAAAAALAFVLLAKRTEAPASTPMVAPHAAPARRAVEQAIAPVVKPPELSPPRAKSPKRAKPAEVQYYLALDDEPIDTGVVMRVALDGTGVQADVIFDAEGRPRAIRTVK